MAKPIRIDLDFGSVATCKNLPNPVDDGDAVNYSTLKAQIEGLKWKTACRVATTGNINLSSAPSSIDGVTLQLNDRVLVKDQTTSSQNGIYVFNGSGNAMTRALDANTADEISFAVVTVSEGTTNAKTTWANFSKINTLGTDPITFESFGGGVGDATESTAGKIRIATQTEVNTGTDDTTAITPAKLANWSGRIRKYTTTIGDGTNTSYTVTHNLGTRDVQVTIYRNTGNYEEVIADVRHTSTTTCTINFATAPSSNEYRVVVIG